jgi:hypothetical protein
MFTRGFKKIAAAKWKKYLNKVIASGDKQKLEDFTYRLLQNPKTPLAGVRESSLSIPHTTNLRTHVFAGEKMPHSGDLRSAFIRSAKELRDHSFGTSVRDRKFDVRWARGNRVPSSRGGSWAIAAKYDPEEMVEVSHGGTRQYLEDFLKGKELGYSEKGIFVSPRNTDRDKFYAGRATAVSGGTPAILTGKIKAKHLSANNRNHSYEALLRSEDLLNLQDIKIQTVDAQDPAVQGQKRLSSIPLESTFKKFTHR